MFDEYEKRDFDDSIYDDMLDSNEDLDDNYFSDEQYGESDDGLIKDYVKYSFAEKAGFEEDSVEVEIDRSYLDIEEEFTVESPGDEMFLTIHIKSDISSTPDEPAGLFAKELLYKAGKEEEADGLNLGDQYFFDLCLRLNIVEKRTCVVKLNLYSDESYKNKIDSIEVYGNDEPLEEFEDLEYENAYMSVEEIEEEVDYVLNKLFKDYEYRSI